MLAKHRDQHQRETCKSEERDGAMAFGEAQDAAHLEGGPAIGEATWTADVISLGISNKAPNL